MSITKENNQMRGINLESDYDEGALEFANKEGRLKPWSSRIERSIAFLSPLEEDDRYPPSTSFHKAS